jgi:hypothetical protein
MGFGAQDYRTSQVWEAKRARSPIRFARISAMQTGMKTATIRRPEASEYNEYYEKYVSLIDDADLLGTLESQIRETRDLFAGFPEERGTHAYDVGKWTVKEVISHVLDGERIFGYRLLRIARGDQTPMEGFEQDDYIKNSHANERSFNDLLCEFAEVRAANLRLMHSLDDADWQRVGMASGYPVSARALGFIMAGHVRHHLNIIQECYLAA